MREKTPPRLIKRACDSCCLVTVVTHTHTCTHTHTDGSQRAWPGPHTHTHTHTHTGHRGRGWAWLPAEAPSPVPQATGSRCLGTDLRSITALPQELRGGGWVEGRGSKQTPQLSLRPSMSLGAPVRPRFKQPSPPDDPGPHLDGSLFPFHRLQGAWQGSPRTSSGPGVLRWDLSQWQGRRQLRESHQRPISKMQWKTKALELLTGQSLHS